ncbi:hypothetical protein [Capnocytophaga sp.]|uniref:hypothetical protein n=1 Tax=Capnocytophaga sp. TaxID=44737 RepID=UPI0026DABEF3|nr:hypothetical protein [Capnocytophaga sp.]MDO5104464.1 hypothetical protein [Capnocytophaga sp.]
MNVKNNKQVIDYPLITDKKVFYNPQKYLKFFKKNKEEITNVKVIPAKLGKKGFGVIEVETIVLAHFLPFLI